MKRLIAHHDHIRIDGLRVEAETCLGHAREAVRNMQPVTAREWFDAADAALRAIRTIEAPWPDIQTANAP